MLRASYRLSAAVGIACGGGLYFAASFSTALNLLLLRFGPRTTEGPTRTHSSSSVSQLAGTDEWKNSVGKDVEAGLLPKSYGGAEAFQRLKTQEEEQLLPPTPTRMAKMSLRNRPSLM